MKIKFVYLLIFILIMPVLQGAVIPSTQIMKYTLRKNFTHKVFVEVGTSQNCKPCHYWNDIIHNIYDSGEYDFHYVEMIVFDYNGTVLNDAAGDWYGDYDVGSVPKNIMDADYRRVANDSETFIEYLNDCGNRDVSDIFANMKLTWLGNATINVRIFIRNKGETQYNGHIRASITEIVSRYSTYYNEPYNYGFLDFAFDQDITISAGGFYTDSITWNGNDHQDNNGNNFGDIVPDNIQVVMGVMNNDDGYVDETVAAIVSENNPPNEPSNPSPENEAMDVEPNTDLSWECSDPEEDDLTYDIYFGNTNPPPLVESGHNSKSFDPGILDYETTYYWIIVAWDLPGDFTEGPIWSFKTKTSNNGPLEEWNRTYGGINEDSAGKFSFCQAQDGGYVLIGETKSYGELNHNFWLIKTNENGVEEWNRTFGGDGIDKADEVIVTSDNGYIMIGYTTSYGAGSRDIWLIKTNDDGIEEWSRTYGGSLGDVGFSIRQTNDNGFIMTGATASYGTGSIDVWLIKIDETGNEEWNRTYGGDRLEEGNCVQIIPGGYIIVGHTRSYGAGKSDVILIKTDEYGNMQWMKTYGGSEDDVGLFLCSTLSDGYAIVGQTSSFGAGGEDVWLIGINDEGKEELNKTYGGVLNDRGYCVRQTSDSCYLISGGTSSYGAGNSDLWLIKTNFTGAIEWSETYGGAQEDSGHSVLEISDFNYVITGYTSSYGSGDFDVWLIKVVDNYPPNLPIIDGPDSGTIGIEYEYFFTSTDPDGDDIAEYIVNWGDGTVETITGPFNSGTPTAASHIWTSEGTFTIKTKSIDVNGLESQEATKTVTMPRNKIFNRLFLNILQNFLHNHPFLFPIVQKLLIQLGYGL